MPQEEQQLSSFIDLAKKDLRDQKDSSVGLCQSTKGRRDNRILQDHRIILNHSSFCRRRANLKQRPFPRVNGKLVLRLRVQQWRPN